MKGLWIFLSCAVIGVLMNTMKENFPPTVTTIVLFGFGAACLILDRIKSKRNQDQSDKKYESIWWTATLLVFLLIILNNTVIKIEILTVIIAVAYIIFMVIVRSRLEKAKTD